MDPGNTKALLRGARAAFALGFFLQAVRFCTEGIAVSPDCADFTKLPQELIAHYNERGDPEFETGLDPAQIEEMIRTTKCSRTEAMEALRNRQREVSRRDGELLRLKRDSILEALATLFLPRRVVATRPHNNRVCSYRVRLSSAQ